MGREGEVEDIKVEERDRNTPVGRQPCGRLPSATMTSDCRCPLRVFNCLPCVGMTLLMSENSGHLPLPSLSYSLHPVHQQILSVIPSKISRLRPLLPSPLPQPCLSSQEPWPGLWQHRGCPAGQLHPLCPFPTVYLNTRGRDLCEI